MSIVLVRVDDRLIHGQVLESWVPSTRAQEVVIANDSLAGDQVQKMIMQAAIPYSINLVIDYVEKVACLLKKPEGPEIRRLVIVDDPVDALRLKRAGVCFHELNLGNLSTREVAVCLSRTVSIGAESLEALRMMLREGVRVSIQTVPFEKPLALPDIG
jgi:mannose/fructose/N-acetylgalactosamine-specific phosphotransferase system component IIB